jgi:hypothetical protein
VGGDRGEGSCMLITQPKIFISSTIYDLPNERKAAFNAVSKVGAFPVMSEITIEAQNTDSLTTCLNKVKESDIYILILGGRYGWQPEGKESITELEFQTAKNCNLPIFIFNTIYPKDELQKEFEKRVESFRFRKTISDAFELENEIEKVLKEEIGKKQNELFNKTEPVYSNLVRIKFPQYVYLAELDIDKNKIEISNEKRGKFFRKKLSLFDYVLSALYMKNISFPHDWVLDGRYLLTFHDLQDHSIPLTQVIDRGTVERLSCDEYYCSDEGKMSRFKYLLKKCLEAKLYKLNIKWINDEGLFAFTPIQKNKEGQWLPRTITWSKTNKKSTRTVVDVIRNLKNKNEVFNLKCLAFRSKFEFIDNEWLLSLKPEWIFLWSDFKVCPFGYKSIQWMKRVERNMHVFNHFNFILNYLQPSGQSLFPEFRDYPFLTIGQIEKFDFAPIVPDNIWVNLEEQGTFARLTDDNGDIGLFGL